MGVMATDPSKPFMRSLLRGLRGRCPRCGDGKLFYRYLKISPECPVCALDLDAYPADDGPAYFTILLVGHLVIAPILLFPIIWRSPAVVALPAVLIPLVALTLTILPRVKGAFVGVMYAMNVRREDAIQQTSDRVELPGTRPVR